MTKPGRDHRADLVLWNGKVITVDAADTLAQAVAIKGDRILAVGSSDEVLARIRAGDPAALTAWFEARLNLAGADRVRLFRQFYANAEAFRAAAEGLDSP